MILQKKSKNFNFVVWRIVNSTKDDDDNLTDEKIDIREGNGEIFDKKFDMTYYVNKYVQRVAINIS